jgi:hypoxanthine-DNA glycosylase
VDDRTQVLVLGSLPGEASLARVQYYGHPRNQFWPLMEAVTGVAMPTGYEERLRRLLGAGVGLWDVVKSASRVGSLDTAIRRHEPNALGELVARLPALKAVGFNGARASLIGRKALGPRERLALIDLPSSSPAYTLPFDEKAAAWLRLRPFLS